MAISYAVVSVPHGLQGSSLQMSNSISLSSDGDASMISAEFCTYLSTYFYTLLVFPGVKVL